MATTGQTEIYELWLKTKFILVFLEHYLPCPSYFTDLAYKFEHFAADEPVSLRL